MYLFISPFLKKAKSLGLRSTEANRDFTRGITEYLGAIKILKATGSYEGALLTAENRSQEVQQVGFASELNSNKVQFISQVVPVVLVAIIIGISTEILEIDTPTILIFLVFMIRILPKISQFQLFLQKYLTSILIEVM